jgi:carbon starvation protein CstA
MVKMKREKFLWIPLIPTAWLLVCTLTAGWQKLFHEDPKIGFIANARKFADAAARGEVLAPAKSMEDMSRVVLNNYIDAGLCALFVAVVVATVFFGIRAALAARTSNTPTSKESDYVAVDAVAP